MIISSSNIGGSEKRFSEFWLYIQNKLNDNKIHLVITPELYNKLLEINELKQLKKFLDKIIFIKYRHGSRSSLRKELLKFHKENAKKGAVFHFVMNYFYYPLYTRKVKTIFSFTTSSMSNLNLNGKIDACLSFIMADCIDILDPQIFKKTSKILFYKKRKIFQTKSSTVNTQNFSTVKFEERNNTLVFLGRFNPIKQIIPLLKAIPYIQKKLDAINVSNVKFYFLGHGRLLKEIEELIKSNLYSNIDITIKYDPKPQKILEKSKVFFSLQKNTNYPSKSLLEALSSGNIPVVTDVGSTRKIALPEFSYYVKESFTSDELASTVAKVFLTKKTELEQKSRKARAYVKENFSIEKMAKYYLSLYGLEQNKSDS